MIKNLFRSIEFFILACAYSVTLYAQSDLVEVESKNLTLSDCIELKSNLRFESKEIPKFNIMQMLTLQLNPGHYIHLSKVQQGELFSQGYAIPQENFVVENNLEIFVSKIDDSLFKNYDDAKAIFNKLLGQITSLMKGKINQLESTSTDEECIIVSKQKNITKADIISWNNSLLQLKSVNDGMWVHYFREKLSNFFQYQEKVNVISTNGYHNILDKLSLKDSVTADNSLDIGLIFHADSSGVLYDLSGYIVPRSFFDKLAELKSIRNIVIFSCYGQAVFSFYKGQFRNLEKLNKAIYLTELGGSLSQYGVTPSNGVVDFFRKYILTQQKKLPFYNQE